MRLADGFVVNPPPGGLSFLQLMDEVQMHLNWAHPQLVHRLATVLCRPSLQGPELDLLHAMVALTALFGMQFVEDFRQRVEVAALIPLATDSKITLRSAANLLSRQNDPSTGSPHAGPRGRSRNYCIDVRTKTDLRRRGWFPQRSVLLTRFVNSRDYQQRWLCRRKTFY